MKGEIKKERRRDTILARTHRRLAFQKAVFSRRLSEIYLDLKSRIWLLLPTMYATGALSPCASFTQTIHESQDTLTRFASGRVRSVST